MKNIIAGIFLIIIVACKNDPAPITIIDSANSNTTSASPDSLLEEEADCYSDFFKNTFAIDTNNITIVNDEGKEFKLPAFIEDHGIEPHYLQVAIKDIDKDSVPELWIWNYTGGAHCCDEWQVFLKQNDGRFKHTTTLLAGNVCVEDSIFSFSFGEPLGYFKSCFACGYEDSATGFVMMREINLRFRKGRFEVVTYTPEDEAQLIKNLQLLKTAGASGDKDRHRDIKKEFAMNIAVYHYNHNKDRKLTKKLFDEYYPFNDRATIWKELVEYLADISEFNGI